MNEQDNIVLSTNDALLIIEILEETVVSFHRIFSRAIETGDAGPLLEQYFMERDVWRRMSTARAVLSTVLDRQLEEETLTTALRQVRYFPE